jgi:uncharacterized protein with ATP-grasp and redox domains
MPWAMSSRITCSRRRAKNKTIVRTSPDCLPCLLKQALFVARRTTADVNLQQRLLTETARQLSAIDFTASPPEYSMDMYARIAKLANCPDPFADLKEESNRLALELRSLQEERLDAAPDPLLAAVKLAIAANVIDYGTQHQFDARKSIEESALRPLAIVDYQKIKEDLTGAGNVLYLADNCGELVFDGLLIERFGKKTTLAVKKSPIINDALAADARHCGLDRVCTIISNGTACPGTPLTRCSHSFREAFRNADLIISKGQGNFETLSTIPAPLYFLLTVKCNVVADHIRELFGRAVCLGEPVLLRSPFFHRP